MAKLDHGQKIRAAQALHEQARYLRGRFLNHVAVIERELAVLLTEYFCRDDENKKSLFFEKIMQQMSLDRKQKLLIDIVKADYPEYWDSNRDILKNLNCLRRFRNAMAHSIIDVSDEALQRPLEQGVAFIQWQKGEPVTEAVFEEYEVMADMISGSLVDIRRMLPFKERFDE